MLSMLVNNWVRMCSSMFVKSFVDVQTNEVFIPVPFYNGDLVENDKLLSKLAVFWYG